MPHRLRDVERVCERGSHIVSVIIASSPSPPFPSARFWGFAVNRASAIHKGAGHSPAAKRITPATHSKRVAGQSSHRRSWHRTRGFLLDLAPTFLHPGCTGYRGVFHAVSCAGKNLVVRLKTLHCCRFGWAYGLLVLLGNFWFWKPFLNRRHFLVVVGHPSISAVWF